MSRSYEDILEEKYAWQLAINKELEQKIDSMGDMNFDYIKRLEQQLKEACELFDKLLDYEMSPIAYRKIEKYLEKNKAQNESDYHV